MCAALLASPALSPQVRRKIESAPMELELMGEVAGRRILEIGCGGGQNSIALADQVEVRFARPTDLDDCIALDHPTMPAEVIERKIAQREIIVAEKAGRLVGYLCLEYLWSLVPYIALIWVVEDQRRQGIGKVMLHYLENVLREQGHTALYSSSQANEPEPQAWHRHVGFQECGFIAGINAGGVGEIFFRKNLNRQEAL